MAEQVTLFTTELDTLQKKADAIGQAIQALEKKILDIGGARLLAQKSKVDGLRLHINLSNEAITKAEVTKAKAEKDSIKLHHAIEGNTVALREVEAENEELTKRLEECGHYVDELKVKVDAAQAAADNSKDDLESLKAELDAKTEEIQAFRQREVRSFSDAYLPRCQQLGQMDLHQALNETRKESAENEKAIDHWRTEHDALKLEEVEYALDSISL